MRDSNNKGMDPSPADDTREGEAPAEPGRDARGQPIRTRPVHGVEIPANGDCIVFLTVCCRRREPWLASPVVHERLTSIWRAATAWRVGRYVLMPDHLHLFASPGEPDLPFDNWVRFWKSQYSRRDGTPGRMWQTDHWDRRLRSGDGYDTAWEYVRNNPVRKGLVALPDEWPFQGELFELRWD